MCDYGTGEGRHLTGGKERGKNGQNCFMYLMDEAPNVTYQLNNYGYNS